MREDYTVFSEDSLRKFAEADCDYDSLEIEAIDFLRNPQNFRTFKQGLIELLNRKNFTGDTNNIFEMTDYLYGRLCEINSTLEKKTVQSWFDGSHRPKIEPVSRPRMYEICFALGLTFNEVVWFFHHVHYDRAFNCHDISEGVFYFAFLHGMKYSEALEIINEVNSSQCDARPDAKIHTSFIKERIRELTSPEELKSFLTQNKANFTVWNNTAIRYIKQFFTEITGNEDAAKPIIKNIQRRLTLLKRAERTIELNINEINKCGLLVREIIFDAKLFHSDKYEAEKLQDILKSKNTFSHTFILDNILGTNSGLGKSSEIPYIVRNNFPSKKVLSDVINSMQSTTLKSYDAIRKTLILFHFYVFWCNCKLGNIDNECEKLFETYREEADILLEECGYEVLYSGNPYDWVFLFSANAGDCRNTLKIFRDMVLFFIDASIE
ncbi:MAG: hypothetical protein IJU48_04270 [Synergistaceae bacterium]|nr:hypothetical protein [Synergistaceae bacterium]